jgi:hypothetical protein
MKKEKDMKNKENEKMMNEMKEIKKEQQIIQETFKETLVKLLKVFTLSEKVLKMNENTSENCKANNLKLIIKNQKQVLSTISS